MATIDKAPTKVSIQYLAAIIGRSERQIRDLVKQGIFTRAKDGSLAPDKAVQAYIDFKARPTNAQDRVTNARAAILELELRERERQLVLVADAMAALDFVYGRTKADLAGIPARITDDIALRRKIEDGIDATLHSLADRFDKAGTDLETGRDAFEAGPEDDPEQVGSAEPDLPANH